MDFLGLREKVFFLIGILWGRSYPYRPSFFFILSERCKSFVLSTCFPGNNPAELGALNDCLQELLDGVQVNDVCFTSITGIR
jgi:hypothetical protein